MSSDARRSFRLTNRWLNPRLARRLRSGTPGALGKRLALIEYIGWRTGQRHSLVTQYQRHESTAVIQVGQPDRKTWWRNFLTAQPVCIWLDGSEINGLARVDRSESDGVRVIIDLRPGAFAASRGATRATDDVVDLTAAATVVA